MFVCFLGEKWPALASLSRKNKHSSWAAHEYETRLLLRQNSRKDNDDDGHTYDGDNDNDDDDDDEDDDDDDNSGDENDSCENYYWYNSA